MKSRMDKYYNNEIDNEETVVTSSRSKKNQDLYKEVSNLELEHFDLDSNVSVIGKNSNNIDIDKIRDMLDKKYRDDSKKNKIGDTEEIELPKINLDETREYDINTILEKAKESKEVDYEKDRLKKVRDDQADILKTIDNLTGSFEDDEEDEDDYEEVKDFNNKSKEAEKLLDLINTITAKELIKEEALMDDLDGEMDPLDLLSDLRGDNENTRIMGALTLDGEENEEPIVSVEELTREAEAIINEDETEEVEKEEAKAEESEVAEDDKDKKIETEKLSTKEINKKALEIKDKKDKNLVNLDESFIGNTSQFKAEDFDDFDDLKDDGVIIKSLIRVLVILIIIVVIGGLVVLADKYLGLGLF